MAAYNFENIGCEKAKERYAAKLATIEMDCCPYQLPADAWVNDPTHWPPLEWPEVYQYLIDTPGVFTRESMKNRKSLDAYNQFVSGWVRLVFYFQKRNSNFLILKAAVMPSQRINEEPHIPWVAINLVGNTVAAAHCTCMAGLGESCSHVAALLFKIEAAVRAGFTRTACTEKACTWNCDFVRKVKAVPISQVQFYSDAAISKYRRDDSVSLSNNAPTDTQVNIALSKLAALKEKPIVLHCFSEYCDRYVPTFKPEARAKLPNSLQELYSPLNLEKSYEEISSLSRRVFSEMKVSDAVVQYVQKLTVKQAKSLKWHEIRTGRITASKAHNVLHTDLEHPSQSLIFNICKPSSLANTQIPPLKWGIDNEPNAIKEYLLFKEDSHKECRVDACGLTLHKEMSFLGASPDGIFHCACHDEKYLLEVKCPFSMKDTLSIEEAINQTSFFIDQHKSLKRSHKYFTQIQMQLFVCGYRQCELIVWSPNWLFCSTVTRDDEFLANSIPVLQKFYLKVIIPELLTRRLENDVDSKTCVGSGSNRKYCICESPLNDLNDGQKWVRCNSTACQIMFFHLQCVNLKNMPKNRIWYCKDCRKAKKAEKEVKKKTA